MQTLRLLTVGNLALTDVSRPVPGPGEILVRVEASGICGTDRHLFHGEFPSKPPLTLGHEFSGIVESIGPGVSRLNEGDRVTGDPNIACQTCDQCRSGRVNLCRNLVAIGVHRDGGMAQYVVMPQAQAHPLPFDLDPLHGALSEPLSCTLHGLDLAAIRPGESVVVIGGGVIGQLAVQLARLAGAGEVLMLTRDPGKRRLAENLGATGSAATAEEALALLPGGADVVLECAGVGDTVEMAPRLTRTGGRIVILGVLAKGVRTRIEPFDLLFREISLRFSFLNPFTHARAAGMIGSGLIKIDPLISRVVTLAEAATAIAGPARPADVKLLIRP